MAECTLKPDSQQFPPGTKLKVYPRAEPESGVPLSGQPPGVEVEEVTVASDGHVTVKGLTEGAQYVGWAQTPDRYLRFRLSKAEGGGGGGAPTGAAGGDLEGSEYPNPVVAAEKITAAKLAANSVEASKIKAKAIDTTKLTDALKAEVEAGGSPTGAAGGDLEGTYPNPVVAAGKIIAAKLAAEAVETGKIKNLAVTEGKLAAEAVTEGKLGAKAVSEAKLTAAVVAKWASEREAAETASTPRLALHAAVEANGTTATVNQLTPVNATTEARTIKLPATGTDGNRLIVEKQDGTANIVTIEGSIRGEAAQTLELKTFRQAIEFTCFSNSWYPSADYLRLASLDSRYALTTDARLSDERTPAAGTVTAAKLASEAVTNAAVKKETLTKDRLTVAAQEELKGSGGAPTGVAGGVLAGEYPNPTLAAEGVTTAAIKAKAITAALHAANSVESEHVKAKAITAAKLAENAVEAEHIKEGAVTETKLATDSVVAAKIKEGAVTAVKLAAEAVEAAKIKSEAVTETKIGAKAVVAAKIAANAVETEHIKAEAVTAAKIASQTIGAEQLNANAVTEPKIKAGAVTETKLGAESVSAAKLQTGAVAYVNLASPIAKPTKPAEGATNSNARGVTPKRTFALLGNGAKTGWALKHELKTRMITVSVQKAESEEPGEIEPLSSLGKAKPLSTEEAEVTFTVAPTAGTQYFVTFWG